MAVKSNFWTSKWAAVIVFGAVIIIWGSVPYITGWFAPKFTARGPFGDQFGSVTALFSGLAFAGLILTLFMQSKELNLTRKSVEAQTEELKVSSEALKKQVEEMSNQRVEMEAMKDAQQAQADYMARQAFENTFFQMLKLWNGHIEAFGGRSELEKGLLFLLLVDVGEYVWPEDDTRMKITSENHKELYSKIFTDKIASFSGPYLLLLLHILKHIDSAQVKGIKKANYAKILRAQLSPAEKKLLFFNCAFQNKKILKPLLEKYSILASLDKKIRDKNPHITEYYKPKVFE